MAMRFLTVVFATLFCLVSSAVAAQDLPVPATDSTLADKVLADEPETSAEDPEGEDEESGPKLEMEEMFIVANRSKRKQFETGRSVDAVSAETLARKSPEALPDALNETAGVHVQKTNGGAGAPIIRGMVGPDNLILVDGVRFNNSTFRTGPNQYLSLIDPWSLERVEVVRGPGSVWYGSDAMGGVINAITLGHRTPANDFLGGSGRLLFNSSVLGGGGTAQADLTSGLTDLFAGGTFVYNGDLRAGGGETQPLSNYNRFGGRFKATQVLDKNWAVTEAAFWNSLYGAGRTDSLGQGRIRNYDNDDLLSYVRAERFGKGFLHHIQLNLSYHRTRETVSDYRCKTDDDGIVTDRDACIGLGQDILKKRAENEDIVHTPGFFATWEARLWDKRLRVQAGGEGYYDLVESSAKEAAADGSWEWKDKDRGNYSDDSTYLSLGAFLGSDVDFVKFGKSRFNLGLGGRVSHFAASAADVPGIGDLDYSNTGLVGTASLKYLFSDLLNVYADFSQGFRSPNLQESTALGNTGKSFDAPNDSLEPVRSNTFEVGAKVSQRYVRLNAAGFVTMLDNVFERVELTQAEWEALGLKAEDVGELPVYRRENAASGLYKGVEGGLSVGPFVGVSLWSNAAWLQGDIENAAGEENPASRVPPLMGAGGIKWEDPDLGLYAEFFAKWALRQDRLAGEDYTDLRICEDPGNPGKLLSEADCKGTPGWVTYNFRAGYAPFDFLDANISLENLADTNYKYHGSGIDAPGFNAMATVSARY